MKRGFSLGVLLSVLVLLTGYGAAPALALYAPCPDVTYWWDQSGTAVTVHCKVTDPISGQDREDTWTLNNGDQNVIESLQMDSGIVVWIGKYKSASDTHYQYSVNCRVFDPIRGIWMKYFWGWWSGYTQWQVDSLIVKDGVVAWKRQHNLKAPLDGMIEYGVCYATYEPGGGTWPFGESVNQEFSDGGHHPEVLRVKDGVVAWPMTPGNGQSRKWTVNVRVFDRESNNWIGPAVGSYYFGYSNYNDDYIEYFCYDSDQFDWIEIIEGTVRIHWHHNTYHFLPVFYVTIDYVDDWLCFDPNRHFWFYTSDDQDRPDPIRRVTYLAQPSSGYAPLWVCFWDTSFAFDTSITPWTWFYSFGDSGNSPARSPLHRYSYNGVFTVEQTIDYNNSPLTNSGTITVNQLPTPTGAISINNGAPYTTTRNVTLALNASADTTWMRFRNPVNYPYNANNEWLAWEPYTTASDWYLQHILVYPDGSYNVTVQFKNDFNVQSPEYTASIILDTTPPAATVTLNDGATTTYSPKVTLKYSATDANGVSKMRYMCFTQNQGVFSIWHPLIGWDNYQPGTQTLTFNPAPGQYTVIMQFQDVAGNISETQASITKLNSAQVALPRLLAFYPFNGNAKDLSGNRLDATVHGAPPVKGGLEGETYAFDGTSSYIQAPVDINPSKYPKLTMGAWVQTKKTNPRCVVLTHDNGGYDRTLSLDERGGGSGWSAFCGSGQVLGYQPATADKWTFLAVVYDQTSHSVKLYVDDNPVLSKTGTLGEGLRNLTIGTHPTASDYFKGLMNNVFIFGDALTEAQIAYLRDNGASAILTAVRKPGALGGITGLLLSD
jgi:hypothetical protein